MLWWNKRAEDELVYGTFDLCHKDGSLTGKKFLLKSPTTIIGRSSSCDVHIDKMSASRLHASLVFDTETHQFTIRCLSGDNTVVINGDVLKNSEEAPAADQSEILVGDTLFKLAINPDFQPTAEPTAEEPREEPLEEPAEEENVEMTPAQSPAAAPTEEVAPPTLMTRLLASVRPKRSPKRLVPTVTGLPHKRADRKSFFRRVYTRGQADDEEESEEDSEEEVAIMDASPDPPIAEAEEPDVEMTLVRPAEPEQEEAQPEEAEVSPPATPLAQTISGYSAVALRSVTRQLGLTPKSIKKVDCIEALQTVPEADVRAALEVQTGSPRPAPAPVPATPTRPTPGRVPPSSRVLRSARPAPRVEVVLEAPDEEEEEPIEGVKEDVEEELEVPEKEEEEDKSLDMTVAELESLPWGRIRTLGKEMGVKGRNKVAYIQLLAPMCTDFEGR